MYGPAACIDGHASKLTAATVSGRQQTCGQLKVTITSPGAMGAVIARPQPSNTTIYLDSCASTTAMSPSAGRRVRADISSIAAPKHAAHQGDVLVGTAAHHDQRDSRPLDQSRGNVEPEEGRAGQQAGNAGTTFDLADTGSNAVCYTDAPGMLAPADQDTGDPSLQLKTQMQQLSALSRRMSQRMTLSDCHNPDMGQEAARDRADAVHGPETGNLTSRTAVVIEAGATCPPDGMHTAQHAQRDAGKPLGGSHFGGEALLSAEGAQEAATFEHSTGNAYSSALIFSFKMGISSLQPLSLWLCIIRCQRCMSVHENTWMKQLSCATSKAFKIGLKRQAHSCMSVSALQCHSLQCHYLQCHSLHCHPLHCHPLHCHPLQCQLCTAILCTAILCTAILFSAILCTAILCTAILCTAILCTAILCTAILCSA